MGWSHSLPRATIRISPWTKNHSDMPQWLGQDLVERKVTISQITMGKEENQWSRLYGNSMGEDWKERLTYIVHKTAENTLLIYWLFVNYVILISCLMYLNRFNMANKICTWVHIAVYYNTKYQNYKNQSNWLLWISKLFISTWKK